jgi:nucleotide-binding universal stress UspA family protein
VKIARPLGLEILLLRVMMRVPPQTIEGSRQVIDHTDRLCQELEQYLLERADVLCAAGMRVQTAVRVGDPATEIVEAARETGADLIAMTTHGRSGLGRLLFGSVAEAVLRRAHVPVFLLRVSEPQTAMRAA